MQLVHVFAWGTITSLMYFGAVLLLLIGGGVVDLAASRRPWFRRMATLGYGVYLVHIPLIDHVLVPVARGSRPPRLDAARLARVARGGDAPLVRDRLRDHVFIEKPSLWIRQRLAG